MYKVIRFFLFLFSPEFIHQLILWLIKLGSRFYIKTWVWRRIFTIQDIRLEREVFGIRFPNPVGLAAGFDKNAKYIDGLQHFGFGFIEIGTVTPVAQDGNPKPRIFRIEEDNAIINRMGFNNDGLAAVVTRLKNKKSNIIVGGNIGKNKITPNELAIQDYEICFNALFPYVDYFVVNVSSPNTPGLRDLQEKEPLTALLNKLQELNTNKNKRKPILLKIAPDLTNEQLDDIIQIVISTKIDGVIATNTTISRDGLKTDIKKIVQIGSGGLSGKPLKDRSTEVIRYLFDHSAKAFPIIGVGGIHSPEDAMEKLSAGASLIQLYTGFIYEGPKLVKKINKRILQDQLQSE